jgi:hypothetical protein
MPRAWQALRPMHLFSHGSGHFISSHNGISVQQMFLESL